jgi:hypothetical protein
MIVKKQRFVIPAALAAGIAGLTACPARAQTVPTCKSLNLPHPIYGAGGSAIEPDIGGVATALGNLSSNPVNILFSDSGGACPQLQSFLSGTETAVYNYWTSDGKINTCTGDGTETIAFAHMGNPVSACPGVTLPATVGDFAAPVQSLNVITPDASTETSISAAALYFIYGFGGNPVTDAPPWTTNPAFIVRRTTTSFAQLLLASAINVPAASFLGGGGQDSKNGDVVKEIEGDAATNADEPIGFVSGSTADANIGAGKVKTLAYKHYDQTCGYLPDSALGATDKSNVRTGQYYLWTPGHFFTKVDGTGKIQNQDVANLIGWYEEASTVGGLTVAAPPVDVLGLTISSGDVPQCAMQVARDGLLGAIRSEAPVAPCTCYFESKTGGTSCHTCTAGGHECSGTQVCRNNFCEAY